MCRTIFPASSFGRHEIVISIFEAHSTYIEQFLINSEEEKMNYFDEECCSWPVFEWKSCVKLGDPSLRIITVSEEEDADDPSFNNCKIPLKIAIETNKKHFICLLRAGITNDPGKPHLIVIKGTKWIQIEGREEKELDPNILIGRNCESVLFYDLANDEEAQMVVSDY